MQQDNSGEPNMWTRAERQYLNAHVCDVDTLGEHQLLQADAFQSSQPLNGHTLFHRHITTTTVER